LPSAQQLEAALGAALLATGVRPTASMKEPDLEKLASHLARTVTRPVLEHAAALLRTHPVATGAATIAAVVAAWTMAADLTGNRAGLLVADDLETAARCVATEKGTLSTLSSKDRLRDLLVYASSEGYFAARRHLGLEVAS
jgi:hypothetical protein